MKESGRLSVTTIHLLTRPLSQWLPWSPNQPKLPCLVTFHLFDQFTFCIQWFRAKPLNSRQYSEGFDDATNFFHFDGGL